MTTSKGDERGRIEGADPDTIAGYMAMLFRGAMAAMLAPWPLVEYQGDPERYARDVLGVVLMAEQVEILEALRPDPVKLRAGVPQFARVAVRGGRKVGKDFVLAVAALWYFGCFPDARVRFTAVKAEQVDGIFWRETKNILRNHGVCATCRRAGILERPCAHSRVIPEAEKAGKLARTGMKADDLREIVGYTAREAEGAAGVSGAFQLNIVDEASGVDDFTIDAIEGNMGGCTFGALVLISNPTRTTGKFFRIFNGDDHERRAWRTFHRSSRTIAAKYGGRIPGIATREWVAEMLEQYRDGSEWVRVHVDGEFPTSAVGSIFDLHSVMQAQARWSAAPCTDGPLYIGVDVAGESGTGDESGFAARIDKKILWLHTRVGLSADAHLTEILGLIGRFRLPNQQVVVVVDRGGEAGSRVYGTLVAYRQANWQAPLFDFIGVDASRWAQRDPKAYMRVRDELIANLADWMRNGGGIPEDAKLAAELLEFRWVEQKRDTRNQLVDKKVMRERLGRSPDRADAVALACWAERHWTPATATQAATAVEAVPQPEADVYDDADAAMRAIRDDLMNGPGRGR
jgi:phage terminase large subunit